VGESPPVAGDPRALAGAFALVVAAEGVARALGVGHLALLAAVPDWRGSSAVVGAMLAFGVGVGGTAACYARWTGVEVRFGPPAPRALAGPVAGALLAGAVASAARVGAPSPSLPVLLNVAVGPALAGVVAVGLAAVAYERTRTVPAPVVVLAAFRVVAAV
jgi:hypothetical protein